MSGAVKDGWTGRERDLASREIGHSGAVTPSHPITPDAVSHEHAAAARALKLDLLKLKIDPVRTVDGDELDETDAEHIVALAVRRLIRGDKS